jgi:hypothetical protein
MLTDSLTSVAKPRAHPLQSYREIAQMLRHFLGDGFRPDSQVFLVLPATPELAVSLDHPFNIEKPAGILRHVKSPENGSSVIRGHDRMIPFLEIFQGFLRGFEFNGHIMASFALFIIYPPRASDLPDITTIKTSHYT